MDKNSNGMVELALLSPNDSSRGTDACDFTNAGKFLVGWYKERIESQDAEGNIVYSYSDKWDFENGLLEVDPSKSYSSSEPVLTLYAAWAPMFEYQFYSVGTDELLGTYSFDPNLETEIKVPDWNKETGLMEMNKFPSKKGYTFEKVFYDKEGTQPVETETIKHPGSVNYENGTGETQVMKLYVEWTEGDWYHIYTAEQFNDNANLSGNYEILADLDFEEEIWPTLFMYGNFEGTINGNGHILKNAEIVQTNNSKANAGLFGIITEKANISDLTFENTTFTIQAGTRVAGTSYGLLAGNISSGATLNGIKILNGTIEIDSGCYFASDDYLIGLVCGTGDASVVETSEIQCVAVGENPETVKITVNGNDVTVVINDETEENSGETEENSDVTEESSGETEENITE